MRVCPRFETYVERSEYARVNGTDGTLLPGIKLAADAVDKDSFAVMVRVESAMGNFLSIASAPKEVLFYSNTTIKEAGLCLRECCAAELLSLCPVPTNPRFSNRRGGILSYTWDQVSSSRGNEIFFVPPERVRFHLAPLPAPRDRRGKHSDLHGEFEHGGAFRLPKFLSDWVVSSHRTFARRFAS